jgi:putative oxidoreductase
MPSPAVYSEPFSRCLLTKQGATGPERCYYRHMRWRQPHETEAPAATVLIRCAVGVVFISEGIQKFLHADAQGAGRFTRIGLPLPDVLGPFVGIVEIVGGALVLLGLCTRLAAVPLAVIMCFALSSTKVPILLGHGYWGFAHTFAPKVGVWAFLHESRTDLSMLSCALFLVAVGADRWSLDRATRLPRRR